jgi:radical SAM-linked protein
MTQEREPIPERLRFRYTKTGRIRYISQRDVARSWERALRRAHLPVAYSEVFSPRPLLSFSLALPTGCESQAEFLDIRFATGVEALAGESGDLSEVVALLDSMMPEGLEVVSAHSLNGSKGSLQEEVTLCSWIVEVSGMGEVELTERVKHLLAAEHLPIERERKGRKVNDDLRPSVCDLVVEGPGSRPGAVRLSAELATKPRGVRPAELLSVLDSSVRLVRASRSAQFIEIEGSRVEPLTEDGRLYGATTQPAAMRSS